MKKLFVLFALVATTSLLNASERKALVPEDSFNLGYFTLNYTSQMSVIITASQEGTFTKTGNFGSYYPVACCFTFSQSNADWTVTVFSVEIMTSPTFTSYLCDDYTSNGIYFLSGLNYCVTYIVTSNI